MHPTRTSHLVRPRRGRMVAGVCAAVADRFGLSRTTVRIGAVASCILPGPQVVMYLAGWLLLPQAR